MAMARKQFTAILALLSYQVWAFEEMFGFDALPDVGVAICLLLALYALSLLRASAGSISELLFLPWKVLFAANLAFFIVGSFSISIRWPGQCVVIGPVAILWLLVHYWPIFVLRKLQGAPNFEVAGHPET